MGLNWTVEEDSVVNEKAKTKVVFYKRRQIFQLK